MGPYRESSFQILLLVLILLIPSYHLSLEYLFSLLNIGKQGSYLTYRTRTTRKRSMQSRQLVNPLLDLGPGDLNGTFESMLTPAVTKEVLVENTLYVIYPHPFPSPCDERPAD
jgi:hypothetical protein